MTNVKCRLCLTFNPDWQCYNVLEQVAEMEMRTTVVEMLTFCIPQIKCDILISDLICQQCLGELNACYEFIQTCITNNNIFKTDKNASHPTDCTQPVVPDFLLSESQIKTELTEDPKTCVMDADPQLSDDNLPKTILTLEPKLDSNDMNKSDPLQNNSDCQKDKPNDIEDLSALTDILQNSQLQFENPGNFTDDGSMMESNFIEPSDSDVDLLDLPPADGTDSAKLVPEHSKEKYTLSYNMFMDWRAEHHFDAMTQNVLLKYFVLMSKKFKPSTLWSHYSMLRATLNINQGVDIGCYGRLKEFLRKSSAGYTPKKSKVFTTEEIHQFLREAPDSKYLLSKVVLIMGVTGACGRHEIYAIKITDIEDLETAAVVHIPPSKNKPGKKFTLTGNSYKILKTYMNLRPPNAENDCLFLNYQKAKCTIQKVGINKIGNIGKQIATYLRLPNPEMYTGHCFRRSSEKILVDSGISETSVKRQKDFMTVQVMSAIMLGDS